MLRRYFVLISLFLALFFTLPIYSFTVEPVLTNSDPFKIPVTEGTYVSEQTSKLFQKYIEDQKLSDVKADYSNFFNEMSLFLDLMTNNEIEKLKEICSHPGYTFLQEDSNNIKITSDNSVRKGNTDVEGKITAICDGKNIKLYFENQVSANMWLEFYAGIFRYSYEARYTENSGKAPELFDKNLILGEWVWTAEDWDLKQILTVTETGYTIYATWPVNGVEHYQNITLQANGPSLYYIEENISYGKLYVLSWKGYKEKDDYPSSECGKWFRMEKEIISPCAIINLSVSPSDPSKLLFRSTKDGDDILYYHRL